MHGAGWEVSEARSAHVTLLTFKLCSRSTWGRIGQTNDWKERERKIVTYSTDSATPLHRWRKISVRLSLGIIKLCMNAQIRGVPSAISLHSFETCRNTSGARSSGFIKDEGRNCGRNYRVFLRFIRRSSQFKIGVTMAIITP